MLFLGNFVLARELLEGGWATLQESGEAGELGDRGVGPSRRVDLTAYKCSGGGGVVSASLLPGAKYLRNMKFLGGQRSATPRNCEGVVWFSRVTSS